MNIARITRRMNEERPCLSHQPPTLYHICSVHFYSLFGFIPLDFIPDIAEPAPMELVHA